MRPPWSLSGRPRRGGWRWLACALGELAVAVPVLRGGRSELQWRQGLAATLVGMGRYQAASAHALRALALEPSPIQAAELRWVLGRARHCLGDEPGAREHFERGLELLAGQPDGMLVCRWRGVLLRSLGREEEALEMDRRAVGDDIPLTARASAIRRLALAALQAGRLAEALELAGQALSLGLRSARRPVHLVAMLACRALHDYERAESHARAALELSRADGDAATQSFDRAELASILAARGRLDDARRLLDQTPAIGDKGRRLVGSVRAHLLALDGQFDAALEAHAGTGAALAAGASARLVRGWTAAQAGLEAQAGRFERALPTLESCEAEPDAHRDLRRRGLRAWLLAALGRGEEAREALLALATDTESIGEDVGTRAAALAFQARAHAALGDHAQAASAWRGYLATVPSPAYLPTAFELLGESLLALGDQAAARGAFREAVAPGIDTHHARLPRRRLESLPPA